MCTISWTKKDGTLVTMVPIYDNIKLMAKRAYCWAQLKLKQNKDKRIALIFHNYPAGNATIGTAMGLDSLQRRSDFRKPSKSWLQN